MTLKRLGQMGLSNQYLGVFEAKDNKMKIYMERMKVIKTQEFHAKVDTKK